MNERTAGNTREPLCCPLINPPPPISNMDSGSIPVLRKLPSLAVVVVSCIPILLLAVSKRNWHNGERHGLVCSTAVEPAITHLHIV